VTGIYIHILRGGRWITEEVDQLTDTELDAFLERQKGGIDDGWNWVRTLAIWIRENVKGETTP